MVPSQNRSETWTDLSTVLPPDLLEVVAAWNALPDAVKAGILAMIRAAQPDHSSGRNKT
ncbi:MAG: hypothetical protein KatS3mg082_1991 [Nitrospiraceae bacterium]|nr:MAG: hypothetical protein KatS3mg082_1991 [Nitrospiraceae bacterium]